MALMKLKNKISFSHKKNDKYGKKLFGLYFWKTWHDLSLADLDSVTWNLLRNIGSATGEKVKFCQCYQVCKNIKKGEKNFFFRHTMQQRAKFGIRSL